MERLELQLRVRAGETHEVAATALGCSAKSVQRLLVKTGRVKPGSTPQSALRLSLPKLIAASRLRRPVERGLRLRWFPQRITARLVLDYPEDLEMRVSHETIYHLCSRVAGGWAMSERVTDDLTLDALDMALARRRPRQGLLHDSDRGSQYAGGD